MITRRRFAGALSAVSALLPLPLRAAVPPRERVRLEEVWIGYGPVLVDRLVPGSPVELVRRNDRACVLFDDRLIGILPAGRATLETGLAIAAAGRDSAGRCWIEVSVAA